MTRSSPSDIPSQPPLPPHRFRDHLRLVGPGLVVAATGVGAGDLVAAAKAGACCGLTVLWCAVAGALLKYALAEGVARWQLATGSTLLEGWVKQFGWPGRLFFLVYLLVWTFMVSAALMAACGLAGHALVPALSVNAWAVIHGVAALFFVWFKGYGAFERVMKWVIGGMFLTVLGSAAVQAPPLAETLQGLCIPRVPAGSTVLILGVIGGVGGTLTLLSYNYWIREKGWSGAAWIGAVRFDLGAGYLLTGLFGVAVMLLAGTVLYPRGVTVSGKEGVLQMAGMLGERFGRPGELIFLFGFWGAVGTSILGVWQSVPYMFGNYMGLLRGAAGPAMEKAVSTRGALYRGYALFMTFPPMLLLLLEKPVWLIVGYAALGAVFMPALAASLLYLNNQGKRMGKLKSGWPGNALLVLALVLFLFLAIQEFLS